MSQREVESVRRSYAAWNRGDLDAALETIHADAEVVQDPGIPGAVTVRGREGVRAWLESFADTWESFQILPEEILEIGHRIVVIARIQARGKASGVTVEQRVGHVFTLRAGQATRWESFTDPARALESVGVRRQPEALG